MISSRILCLLAVPVIAGAVLATPALGQAHRSNVASCCKPSVTRIEKNTQGTVAIPDVTLLNQDGAAVNVHDLVKGKVVVMNFIFTTCTTICPPMGANFAKLCALAGDEAGKDVMLISVSIDPVTDTPARLKAWSDKFNAGPGWTLLTGEKRVVDNLLKTLKVYSPLKEDHAPIVLIGREGGGDWIRANGLTSPEKLMEIIRGRVASAAKPVSAAAAASPVASIAAAAQAHGAAAKPDAAPLARPAALNAAGAPAADDPDLKYFTDVKLSNQFGEEMRLYSDLMHGKVVVINPFFTQCTGSCPAMNTMMEQVQAHLGDRLGRDVNILSITVDPANDTPDKLKEYADRFGAKRGWYFLSGKRENVELALHKLGEYVDTRENHLTVIMIGNVSTRLWKKVNGLAPAADIIKVLDTVVADTGGKE